MGQMTYTEIGEITDTSSTTEAPYRGPQNPEVFEMDIFKTIAPYLRARFGNTERGAALVEYALLLALIAVVCIVALSTLGGKASSKFDRIGDSLS